MFVADTITCSVITHPWSVDFCKCTKRSIYKGTYSVLKTYTQDEKCVIDKVHIVDSEFEPVQHPAGTKQGESNFHIRQLLKSKDRNWIIEWHSRENDAGSIL